MNEAYFIYYPATGRIVPGEASSETKDQGSEGEVRTSPVRPQGWRKRYRRAKIAEWLLYAVAMLGFALVFALAAVGWLEEGGWASRAEAADKPGLVDAYFREGMRTTQGTGLREQGTEGTGALPSSGPAGHLPPLGEGKSGGRCAADYPSSVGCADTCLAAARSPRGSDMPPACHSLPRGRFAAQGKAGEKGAPAAGITSSTASGPPSPQGEGMGGAPAAGLNPIPHRLRAEPSFRKGAKERENGGPPRASAPTGQTETRTAGTPAPAEGMSYLGQWYVTGYDVCESCCGKTDGITASGTAATVGRTCAVNGLPFGARLYIEGLGERVVEDRGGMGREHVDVLCEDHPACYAVTGYYAVYLIGEVRP